MKEKSNWTDTLDLDVLGRLGNCASWKSDVLPLAQARWSWLRRTGAVGYEKEDALVYVLELLDCNSVVIDLTKDEYADILNGII